MECKDLISTSAENSKWFSNVFFRGQQKAAQEHEDLWPPLPQGCEAHLDTSLQKVRASVFVGILKQSKLELHEINALRLLSFSSSLTNSNWVRGHASYSIGRVGEWAALRCYKRTPQTRSQTDKQREEGQVECAQIFSWLAAGERCDDLRPHTLRCGFSRCLGLLPLFADGCHVSPKESGLERGKSRKREGAAGNRHLSAV